MKVDRVTFKTVVHLLKKDFQTLVAEQKLSKNTAKKWHYYLYVYVVIRLIGLTNGTCPRKTA